MHYHRSEHWIILSGNATVIKGDRTYTLSTGDSIDIPANTKHSIKNTGNCELKLIETQIGDIIDKDDIVRLEDKVEL